MKWSEIIKEFMKGLSIKQLLVAIAISLSLVVVPPINILSELMPFDDILKILSGILLLIVVYFLIEIVLFFFKCCKKKCISKQIAKKKIQFKIETRKELAEYLNDLPIDEQKILQKFIQSNNTKQNFITWDFPGDNNKFLKHLLKKKILYELPNSETEEVIYKVVFGKNQYTKLKKSDFKIEKNMFNHINYLYIKKLVFTNIKDES